MSDSNRPWKSLLDKTLAIGGGLLVLSVAAYMAADPFPAALSTARLQVALVTLGLVLNQVGVWKVSSRLLTDRRYNKLRHEVDQFIGHVRQLNTYAIAGEGAHVERVRKAMHRAVDEIVAVAGVVDDD